MPENNFSPNPGFSRVRREEINGAFLQFDVYVSNEDIENADGASPGQSFQLLGLRSEGGTGGPLAPTEVRVRMMIPGTDTQIGETWVMDPPLPTNPRTIRMDDNPLGPALNQARCGMLEMLVEVERTNVPTYLYDSRGQGLGNAESEWYRGFFRVPLEIASSTTSNVSLGGAEPAQLVYGDPQYVEMNLAATCWDEYSFTFELGQDGDMKTSRNDFDDTSFAFSNTGNFAKIDDDYTTGFVDHRITLPTNNISGPSGTIREAIWAEAGHEAGWAKISDQVIEYDNRIAVDPTLTLQAFTLDEPATTVYNVNEEIAGSFEVRDANGAPVNPIGTPTLTFIRDADDSTQGTNSLSLTDNGDGYDFSLRPDNSVNAPATAAGDEKALLWEDVGANHISPILKTNPVGFVSSLLDIFDVKTTYANNDTTVYNRSETATVTGKILNRRGQGYDPDNEFFTSRDEGTSNLEDFSTITGRDSVTGDFTIEIVFSSSDTFNIAPATLAGAAKILRWTDDTANVTNFEPRFGYLSSLLDIINVRTDYENATDTVYNRSESVTVRGTILNRRGDGFADFASESYTSKDAGTGDTEDAFAIDSHDGGTGDFVLSLTYDDNNNIADNTTQGSEKLLDWDDSSGNELDAEPRYAYLSRLLDMVNVRTAFADNATTVYNRGEDVTVLGALLNRRGDGFADFTGAEGFTSLDVGGSPTPEQTFTIVSHSAVTGEFELTFTFDTSGNVAPLTDAGKDKEVRWLNGATGNDQVRETYGFLSSLLKVDSHLQLNTNVLDPNLDTDFRLTSDLGFYSVRISNQRGVGINTISVTDHLRDDIDLTAQQDRTDVTQAVEGNDGYLPLRAWDSALPGGGWDHWIDSGTYEGNTYQQARTGEGTAEFVLLAKDPNFVIVPGGGAATGADDGDHWHPGEDLQVGFAVYDVATGTTKAVDDDGGNPRAFIVLARFNVTLGRAEYLEADFTTWTPLTGGTAHQIQLQESAGDSMAYVTIIPGASTATWSEAELFIVGIGFINSTPYALQNLMDVVSGVGSAHDAGGSFDPVGLALSGILSQR